MAIAKFEGEGGDEFTLETDLDDLASRPRGGFSDEYDFTGDLPETLLGSGKVASEEGPFGTLKESSDKAWRDLGPSIADNEESLYKAENYVKDLKTELKEVEKQLKSTDKGMLEKVARVVDNKLTGGLVGASAGIFKKLTQNGEESLVESEKELLRAQLKVEITKLENRISFAEKGVDSLVKDMSVQERGVVIKKVSDTVEDFTRKSGREPSETELGNMVKEAVVEVAPNSPDAATIRRASGEDLIKSYNPNANLQQFGVVDPKMLGGEGNVALEGGLEQLRQLEAKRAEAQAIKDKTLTEANSWTKLDEDNRDAWAKYYNPADYRATATESGMTQVAPASTISGDYQADLGTLKGTKTDVNLTNADAWQNYFKGVEGYKTDTSTADKTTVAPTSQLVGDYRASGDELRGFDSTIMTSEQRADALNAMNMTKERAEGKKPSVAELSYLQNLDRLIAGQQGVAASQRGSGNPLAMRSIAQQSSQLGQQAVRETAELRAKEQQDAELAYANQANQIMLADQQKAMQEKQMQLEQRVQQTNVELQNAKTALDKDMFNIDAMNKVNQLQAQLDASLQEFNANAKNQIGLQNTQNQVAMTQYAGGQEQAKMINQLQADSTSRANELQKNIQYTQGLLDNAKMQLEKDEFNADSINKVNQLQAQLDTQTKNLNAELQTRTALANAQSNLEGAMWAGQQAQGALNTQLSQERADTLAKYGISREALGSEMDILNSLADKQIALGSAQKGWDYNQQQLARQEDMDFWQKLGIGTQAAGSAIGTLKDIFG